MCTCLFLSQNLTDDECPEDKMNNLQFYLNKSPSAPDDVYIDSFLKDWKNDYKRLERVHSYIQWLFPLREPGVNYMASELTRKEIEAFKKSEDAKKRLVESYELMLGFYGIRLVDKDTGEVKRAENWKERFGNLENMHNNLRITRILKSLGELGFEHYQAPLVHFFLEETLVRKTLSSVKRSVLDYFLFAVLDKQKRQELVRYAYLHFEPKDKFVWCPRKIQRQFRKAEKRSEVVGNGDGKDDSRAKAKEMDTKEDAVDNKIKSPKAEKKSNDKIKPEASPEPKEEVVENGNACSETNNNIVSNGSDCTDDEGMEHSPSAENEDATSETGSGQKDGTQEADSAMQTDGEIKKPPKKKRDDDADSDEDFGSPQKEVKNACNKTTGQQTPLKTSKASLLSGREEKIPRTEYNPTTDKDEVVEMSQESVPALNGSAESGSDKTAEEQINGKESEPMDTDSSPSNGINTSADLAINNKEVVNGTKK
uniref:Opioid growth factor receptor (OGFr) conserved domain-containing protein n=1 Tax=Periophthalmus magnuspinnatus TaxID=409849 RepID=A0A3B3ZKT8_9GOBI